MNRLRLSALIVWISYFIASSILFSLTNSVPADVPVYSGDQAEEDFQTLPPFAKANLQAAPSTVTMSSTAYFQHSETIRCFCPHGLAISQAFSSISSRPPPA